MASNQNHIILSLYYFLCIVDSIVYKSEFCKLRNSKFIGIFFLLENFAKHKSYLSSWIFLGRKKNQSQFLLTFGIRNFLTRCIFFIGTIRKLIRSIRIIISQRIKKRFRRSVRSFMVIGIVRWLMLVSSGLC